MDLLPANGELVERYAGEIAELVWSTGPISYEYHFFDRKLFDAVVLGSWTTGGSLFSADATTLALEGEQLAGICIAMPGPEFSNRGARLASVWSGLVESGECSTDEVQGVLKRSERASWMNPVIYSDTYYVHAIAVKPEFQGRRIGYRLIDHAISFGRQNGFRKFQLDVLSDNPAVEFYRAVGLKLLAETRTPEPCEFGVPTEYRMGMKL